MLQDERADKFLREIRAHPELTDPKAVMDDMLAEMAAGLRGEPSSLMMLPSYIGRLTEAPEREPAIVIDAGGTNLRRALVTFERAGAEVREHQNIAMPGTYGEITQDEFYRRIAEFVLPLTEYSRKIGFIFSYPAEITRERDAVVRYVSKELRVGGLVDSVVGLSLTGALDSLGAPDCEVTVLNDTVACMLGALPDVSGDEELAGLVVGTGVNACYNERAENIGKIPDAFDMIINTEAGGFSRLKQGEADRRLDAGTKDPGAFLFEKQVAGAYLGGLVFETARLAAERGVFSGAFAETLRVPFDTRVIDAFLAEPDRDFGGLPMDGQNRAALYTIADKIYERAAKLVSALAAAVMVKSGGGPMRIAVDGSLYRQSAVMSAKINAQTRLLLEQTGGRLISYVCPENANLKGAAAAALRQL